MCLVRLATPALRFASILAFVAIVAAAADGESGDGSEAGAAVSAATGAEDQVTEIVSAPAAADAEEQVSTSSASTTEGLVAQAATEIVAAAAGNDAEAATEIVAAAAGNDAEAERRDGKQQEEQHPISGSLSRSALLAGLLERNPGVSKGGDGSEPAPDLLLGFRLAPGGEESFFEEVLAAELPARLRGGLVAMDGATAVDLQIRGPGDSPILDQTCEPTCFFDVEVSGPGSYKVIVLLKASAAQEARVSLALGKNLAHYARGEHFQTLEEQADVVDSLLSEIQIETTSLWLWNQAHLRSMETMEIRIYALGFLQLVVLIGMQCFVPNYIRGMLAHRTAGEGRSGGLSPSRRPSSPTRSYPTSPNSNVRRRTPGVLR